MLTEALVHQQMTDSNSMANTIFGDRIAKAEKAYFESTGRKMPTNLRTSVSRSLMNTKDYFEQLGYSESANYLKETTAPGDINAFIHYAYDMITAILPSSVIDEFATIQAMDKRVGEIFFLDIVTGSAKAPKTLHDTYISSQYGPQTGQNYSDERIITEALSPAPTGSNPTFGGTCAWLPLKAVSVTAPTVTITLNYTIGGVDYVATLNSSRAWVGTHVTSGGIASYAGGVTTIVFDDNPDLGSVVTMSYEWDSLALPTQGLPEVDIVLTSAVVYAKRRALKTKWLLDTAAMLSKEHGKDIETELLNAVLAGVSNEIAVEVAADLLAGAAAGSDVQFSITPPNTAIPYVIHRQELYGDIVQADTNIESSVRKVKANFVIGGSDFTNVVRGLPVDMFKPADYGTTPPVGMHVIGTLNNQYKIIQNFDYAHDRFCVGAKGDSWLLTGYVYSPYIPLMTTKPITNEDLVTFRSILSWYGKKMVNTRFYNTGTILP